MRSNSQRESVSIRSIGLGAPVGRSIGTPLVSAQSGDGLSSTSSSTSGSLTLAALVENAIQVHGLHSVAGSPLSSLCRTRSVNCSFANSRLHPACEFSNVPSPRWA